MSSLCLSRFPRFASDHHGNHAAFWTVAAHLGVARLFLILLTGLVIAQGLSLSLLFLERYTAAKGVMYNTLENEVATSIAILDRLPADERADWLARLDRGAYRFVLGPGLPGVPDTSERGAEIAAKIQTSHRSAFSSDIRSHTE